MEILNINDLCKLFEKGIQNNHDREILGQSLFYYCCGKDPTPIIAFGHNYPLYIYSDIVGYGSGDFQQETQILYERLEKEGFQLKEIRKLEKTGNLHQIKNIVLTMWQSPQKKVFFLLYVQNDATQTFKTIYSDCNNYIQPKCICNYRYEGVGGSNYDTLFNTIEKRTEYILGHCHNEKYQRVAEYEYHGDYEKHTKVSLFHRMFWYVY